MIQPWGLLSSMPLGVGGWTAGLHIPPRHVMSKGGIREGSRATGHLPPLGLLRADLPRGSRCGVSCTLVFDFVSLDQPGSGVSLEPPSALI